MAFEIQVLVWDRHKNVAGLNRLMATQLTIITILFIFPLMFKTNLFYIT